ncbi:hypothetical protein LDG_6349 [Legionella drancourtii LLAP12]|uniref:Uncharacterized protein n=1 Tax=Legionella drancourtii LLAP12 TaxID=658187 RepID=G9EM85_9GAMM|nr:hypothetical protein LDG_6349 [Legionella drancourtii LLAP12]
MNEFLIAKAALANKVKVSISSKIYVFLIALFHSIKLIYTLFIQMRMQLYEKISLLDSVGF